MGFPENVQFQLSLSRYSGGLHALRAVPKAKGGKGQKGGLSEYSKIVGKKRQEVTLFFQAAEVYQEVKHEGYPAGLLKRAYHLAAIRKADKRAWSVLVSALIKDGWTVAETKEIVADIRELAIPASWGKLFLPLEVYSLVISILQVDRSSIPGAANRDRRFRVDCRLDWPNPTGQIPDKTTRRHSDRNTRTNKIENRNNRNWVCRPTGLNFAGWSFPFRRPPAGFFTFWLARIAQDASK